MISGIFITATGTGSGKTWLARALSRSLVRAGRSAAALKPVETGCKPDPLDAIALARACARPALAHAPGLYRAALPLAPHAVALETGVAAPDLAALAQTVRDLASSVDHLLVEGAGGLLAPLNATHTMADLARALDLPLLLVAPDALGVLSHVLTAVESAHARALKLLAIILVAHARNGDASTRTNRRILGERLDAPVLAFPHTIDDDDALADAAEHAGLVRALLG